MKRLSQLACVLVQTPPSIVF